MKIAVKDHAEFQRLIIMNGHSIRSFAAEAKVSHGYVSQIISGDRNPGPKTAKKFSDALNKDFDDLFFIQDVHKSAQNKNSA